MAGVHLRSLLPFVCALLTHVAHAQSPTFVVQVYEHDDLTGMVAADFDGDGALDLALAGAIEIVRIVLGNGDGTLNATRHFVSEPRDFGMPGGIVTADFNGDDRLDLAVTLGISSLGELNNQIIILLGNGDGTFGPHAEFPTSAPPREIAVGDFNDDGVPDLVTANRGSSISILRGTGDGAFTLEADIPAGLDPRMVVTGDFDGDGRVDIAVPAVQSDIVSILRGNGDGTFGPRTDYPTGAGPASLAIGDFSNDGILDLVTANVFGDSASIFLGIGDGTLGPRTDLETIQHPVPSGGFDLSNFVQVAAADFSADGELDFLMAGLVSNRHGANVDFALRLGQGDGNFADSLRANVPLGYSTAIATGDFNGDGKVDFALADGGNDLIKLFVQSPLVLDPTSLDFGMQLVGVASSPAVVIVQNTSSAPATIGSVALSAASLDQFNVIADLCSGTPLASQGTCTIDVAFSPANRGAHSASLVLDLADHPGELHVPLSGVGGSRPFDFSMPPIQQSITAGQSAQFTLELLGEPGFNTAVTFSCSSGVPVGATCSFNPASVSLSGGTASATLTIRTTSRSAIGLMQSSMILLAGLLLPIGFGRRLLSRRSRVRIWLPGIGAFFVVLGTLVACGGGSQSNDNAAIPTGTPAGTYMLVVTATAGGVSRTQNVTLVVD